jgi:hypothetical protein
MFSENCKIFHLIIHNYGGLKKKSIIWNYLNQEQNADPLAFKVSFDIEHNIDEYPVVRKNSLMEEPIETYVNFSWR